jgi:hypothetical protein
MPVAGEEEKSSPTILSTMPSGRVGVRTLGDVSATPVFKTGALNHSATQPRLVDFITAQPVLDEDRKIGCP